jgi:hypothetical protein
MNNMETPKSVFIKGWLKNSGCENRKKNVTVLFLFTFLSAAFIIFTAAAATACPYYEKDTEKDEANSNKKEVVEIPYSKELIPGKITDNPAKHEQGSE